MLVKNMIQFPYRRKRERKLYLRSYPKGWLIFVLTLGAASLICALLQHITSSDVHVPMIFVLAVLIVSLSTDGYFYGLLAAIVSVIIEQVLMNLMDNAVTHGGSVTQIRIEATAGDGFMTVSVRDDGRGIPKELLPRLFDGSLPLSGSSRSDGSRFMGIGLSVCPTIPRPSASSSITCR